MKVYIIHGLNSAPNKHWFGWLTEALAKKNVPCKCLAMPCATNPDAQQWLEFLKKEIQMDEQTILIGHSLGCVATLTFLANTGAHAYATILVSGFDEPMQRLPQLNPFIDLYRAQPSIVPLKNSYVFAALDDKNVPYEHIDTLARHLESVLIRFPHGGHFKEEDGFVTFPPLLEKIENILNI